MIGLYHKANNFLFSSSQFKKKRKKKKKASSVWKNEASQTSNLDINIIIYLYIKLDYVFILKKGATRIVSEDPNY